MNVDDCAALTPMGSMARCPSQDDASDTIVQPRGKPGGIRPSPLANSDWSIGEAWPADDGSGSRHPSFRFGFKTIKAFGPDFEWFIDYLNSLYIYIYIYKISVV